MSQLTFLSRKLKFQGRIEEVPEHLIVTVENLVKTTGEPLNEAIERLIIEHRESRRNIKPNTMDYYIHLYPKQLH